MARLVIVDDHDFIRDGIKDMLADEKDLRVIGEASNGMEAAELCERMRPDLALMDVRMPRMDGLEAAHAVKKASPRTSVLMVTMHENPDYLMEALRSGAAGYVLKGATRDELLKAIRGVLSGDSPVDEQLAIRLLRRLADEQRGPSASGDSSRRKEDLSNPLTPRELEVLQLMAQGKANRQIAKDFFIMPGTAKNHVEHIIAKLGVSDRTQAVVKALEMEIITFPGL